MSDDTMIVREFNREPINLELYSKEVCLAAQNQLFEFVEDATLEKYELSTDVWWLLFTMLRQFDYAIGVNQS